MCLENSRSGRETTLHELDGWWWEEMHGTATTGCAQGGGAWKTAREELGAVTQLWLCGDDLEYIFGLGRRNVRSGYTFLVVTHMVVR